MSKLLAKLERKFGKYAIRNLPLYMVILYAIGYILYFINPVATDALALNFYQILQGQVWRLVTWIMVPDYSANLFFILLALYFFFVVGRTLENTWGSFLFNLFIFGGFFFIFAGKVIVTLLAFVLSQGGLIPEGLFWALFIGNTTGAYYIDMSIFFAYAIMYPDARFLVLYIFPIKAKVLGIIYVILMAFNVFLAFQAGIAYGILSFITISMSLMNVILFFAWTKRGLYKSPKEMKRQRDYKVKIKKASAVSRHKCAICGQTAESNPNLQFRYCSKCEGNYEYCSEHLFTHEHVKKNE